jgi:hypothetical protein
VIVAGGGSGGVAAAVGAARVGARLSSWNAALPGGTVTLRNVATYCGLFTREDSRQVVFGVAEEVLAGLHEMNVLSPPVRFTAVAVVFDPETAKRVTPTGTQ